MKDWFYSSTVVVYIRHCHNLKPFITAGVKRKSSRTALQITFDQCPKKTKNKKTMNLKSTLFDTENKNQPYIIHIGCNQIQNQ